MILAELGAAVLVAEQVHPVDGAEIGVAFELLLHLFGEGVDAAHGGQDPQLVANADLAVVAAVDLDLPVRQRGADIDELRLVAVLVEIAEVGG
ncbi:hypothetical protein D3C72_1134770 [compost metagenome]